MSFLQSQNVYELFYLWVILIFHLYPACELVNVTIVVGRLVIVSDRNAKLSDDKAQSALHSNAQNERGRRCFEYEPGNPFC
jgi:hypothetical protein